MYGCYRIVWIALHAAGPKEWIVSLLSLCSLPVGQSHQFVVKDQTSLGYTDGENRDSSI